MRFSVVETDFGDEETKNFGKRDEFVSLTSLYEIKTLATISGDFDNTENHDPIDEDVPPLVLSESNKQWLAIAAGDDISIFAISFDLEHLFTQPFKHGSNICGIGWLGDSHILAAVSSSMEVTFLSADLKAILMTIQLPSTSSCQRAFLSSDIVLDVCYLAVAREDGEVFTLSVPNWSLLSSATKETIAESCRETFGIFETTQAVSKLPLSNIICAGGVILQVPSEQMPFQISELRSSNIDFLGNGDTGMKFARVRSCCNNRFAMGLTFDGLFVVTDLWTFSTIKIHKLSKDEMMQVRSMSNLEIIYCVAVNQKTMLLPVSETADRVILLVESFASKTLSGSDAIKVREIVEAQPEMKLQRLISRNQLDQAEQFAMQFGLDIQVGEVCFSGATTFNSYDKISSLLTYAKKRAITDSDTIDRLLQASYVLATYRLMHGPENNSYSSDSLWQNFVSGVSGEGEWHDLFIYTISSGLIKEARILWNRHIASILPNFNSVDNEEETEANLVEFFKALRATVIGDITCWRDIIAFLEFDFVPLCLSKMTKQGLNSEQICHQILQQSVQNPKFMKQNVERFAKQYMAEHNLEPDGTLYRYIEAESSRSRGVVGASSAWNDHCLMISETISNQSVRSKAVCMIAKGSRPPWSRRLNEAVQSVLKNPQVDQDIKKSLECVCRRAELGEMLMAYLISIGMLDCELSVVQFLEEVQADKGEQVLRSLACRLVDGWVREIDTAVFIWTEESIAKRRRLISYAISVILRFMNQDPTYMQLYEQLRSIERLQENHNMFVTTAHLDSKQWRCATLKRYIEKQERSLTEIMAFSRVLGMTRDEASRLSIKLAIDSGNAIGTLTIIRDALRSVPEASPDLAEVCVHGCEFVLWRLQETVGNVEATPEAEIVEQSVDSIVILSRVLRILEPITSHSLNLQEAVARMHGYASIFLQVVNQCMLDDTTSDSSSSQKEKSNEEVTTDERSRIYGIRRRVGVYQMRNEGPLFSKMEAIAHIASVAQSAVGTEKLEYEARLTFYNEQVMRWNDLFNFLSLSNQDLLEFQARVYAASLLWWNEVEKRDDLGLRASVRNICIRSLQAHPCDLWTPCTLLSSLPPQNIEEVILELRGIVANRKSPQTMINFLRVVQFASILTQNTAHAKMLTDTFTKTLWAKRLGKACLPPTLPRKPIEDAIVEFAKQKVDPDMVVGYIDEFCGVEELPKQMLNYAITLVQSASSSNDEREVKEVPIHPQKAFAAFRDILYTVNPYNYPVIYFIISQLKSTCDIEDKAFVDGCSSVSL
ncbi:unnamed protein product [Nippostrongylus brasiliensis]|uniref:Rod_C domain-containing protein n=1 Tax=Nippostrongylus brasiliensis TaxID=27835 RepID=A0A158R3C7_NIPBR|nr:unnamed protein product [Nippostrongylus brasiliensis]